jgi:hypothetical protein
VLTRSRGGVRTYPQITQMSTDKDTGNCEGLLHDYMIFRMDEILVKIVLGKEYGPKINILSSKHPLFREWVIIPIAIFHIMTVHFCAPLSRGLRVRVCAESAT